MDEETQHLFYHFEPRLKTMSLSSLLDLYLEAGTMERLEAEAYQQHLLFEIDLDVDPNLKIILQDINPNIGNRYFQAQDILTRLGAVVHQRLNE